MFYHNTPHNTLFESLANKVICTDRKPKNTSHNSTVTNTYV
jgi:hypothetical protein